MNNKKYIFRIDLILIGILGIVDKIFNLSYNTDYNWIIHVFYNKKEEEE